MSIPSQEATDMVSGSLVKIIRDPFLLLLMFFYCIFLMLFLNWLLRF